MATKLRSVSPRMIAPAALALFAVLLLIVIALSVGGGGSSNGKSGDAASKSRQSQSGTRPEVKGTALGRKTYVVKPGDTLGSIAERTGVPIERLLALNPSVDPQALVSGQRIKLRE
jgi:LysM repeat protein